MICFWLLLYAAEGLSAQKGPPDPAFVDLCELAEDWDTYKRNTLIAVRGEWQASGGLSPEGHDPIRDELVREKCPGTPTVKLPIRVALFGWDYDSREDLPIEYRPPEGFEYDVKTVSQVIKQYEECMSTGIERFEVTVVGRVVRGTDLATRLLERVALETHGPKYQAFINRPYELEMLYLKLTDLTPLTKK